MQTRFQDAAEAGAKGDGEDSMAGRRNQGGLAAGAAQRRAKAQHSAPLSGAAR